ncbi:MAG: hypothetical protein J0G33_02640 [Afipia felis]|nr:hypothetical protein [Afipia felis]
MYEPNKFVDLAPRDWKSDREKPREPIFGSGAVEGISYLIGMAIVLAIIHWGIGN